MPNLQFKRNPVAAALVGILSSSLLSQPAQAAVRIWDGNGANDNWGYVGLFPNFLNTNWTDYSLIPLPVSGDTLVFEGTNRLTPYNDIANVDIAGIVFKAGAGKFVLGGNAIISTGQITNSSAILQTINLPVSIGSTQIWDGGKPGMAINGLVTLGNHNLTLNNNTAIANSGADFIVGDSGTASLTLSTGSSLSNVVGWIGKNSGSTGSVTVADANSLWANSGFLFVGNSGSGTLNIQSGGKVSNYMGILGNSTGSSGTATVTGANSLLDNSYSLFVGNFGSGTLNIENGGQVSNFLSGYVGYSSGSVGTAMVTGANSLWANGDALVVGFNGSGKLDIRSGGQVNNGVGTLGLASGSTGTATVMGANSLWASNILYVGDSGKGQLNLQNGGLVNADLGILGNNTFSIGMARITDVGSKWNITQDLTVGNAGSGSLFIENGGLVSNRDGFLGGNAAQKSNTGFGGVASVSGVGSQWINSRNLVIGQVGLASLAIKNGGKVSAVDSYLGGQVGSSGTATVADAGSEWTNSNNLTIGQNGKGKLTINVDGTVTIGNTLSLGSQGVLDLLGGTLKTGSITQSTGGQFNWSTGTLNITGVNGMAIGNNTFFGAVPTFKSGQSLDVDHGLSVGSGSFLSQEGAQIKAGEVILNGGYSLSSGSLVSSLEIFGNGNFTQTNGSHTITGSGLYLGFTLGSQNSSTVQGSYQLSGGSLSTEFEYIGYAATGSFNQTGGIHTINKSLLFAFGQNANGIYNLSGGSLNVANIYSDSGNSMLTIDGGSLLVGGGHGNIAVTTLSIGDAVGKTAAHSLSDGSLYAEDEYIGNYGNGTIDQSAGDNTVNKRLMLGFWSGGQGIYNLSGNGAMQSEQAFIGMNGNGSFTQSGASRAYLKEIYLGLNSTGQGSFILSGGELMTSPEVIGYQGIGKFTQTGGSHTVGGLVTLGKSLGSKGSYSLSGGTLTTGGIVAGAGDAQFDWTGGNLQVTNNFNVASGASVFGKQLAVPQDSHFIAPNMGVTQDAVVTQGIGSTVTIAGKLSQLGSYTLAGGTTLQTSSLDNSGSLSIGGGVTDIYGDITNNVDGKISNNALVRFNGALVNNGNVYTDKNASSIFYGAVSGSGSFIGDGTSIFTGGLRPGNSPGLLSASGNVILGDGNQTVMELGGLKRGTEYDAFDVLPGTLALGGNLKIDWANGFTAGSGDSFDLFMADNITGIFANTLFPSLSGINWQLALLHDVYGSTDVYRLTAAAPVPLPASVWLMGMGLMGMVAGARRKA